MTLLLLLDVILPNLVIFFAIWKVENVGMKWYIINLLAAYSVASIGRRIGMEVESRPDLRKTRYFPLLFGLITHIRMACFALTRLIVFFCILELYSIYTFKTKILKALYKRKSRVFIFIYSCTQIVSIPVAGLIVINNTLISSIAVTAYLVITAILYLSSIIILCAAIHTACKHKLISGNERLRNALTPLIFYFLPVTFIDISVAASGAIRVSHTESNTLKVFLQVNAAIIKIRAILLVLCTIFVLPPFRRALFDLLTFKRHRQISVVPLNNANHSVGRNNT